MKKIVCLSISLIASSAIADLPLFTITGSSPILFNTQYSYTVKNNAPYSLSNISLYYAPSGETPQAFVQNPSGSNACTNSFNLAAGASCILYYSIDPSLSPTEIIQGGPEICYNSPHPIYCSVPDTNSQVDLIYAAPNLVAGFVGLNPYQPFVFQNYNRNKSWGIGTTPYPATSSPSSFTAADCNASLCVLAGYDPSHPIQAYSLNNGVDWLANTALTAYSGAFNSTSCSTQSLGTCISVGFFGCAQSGGICPSIVAASFTPTFSWNEISFSPTAGAFYASDCNDTTCATGGTDNQTTSAPLLYQSIDNGVTWNSVLPTLSYTTQTNISALSCAGSTCIAMGTTEQPVSNLFYPFVLIQPAGSGPSTPWVLNDLYSQVHSFSPGTSSQSLPIATPQALSCSGNFCVAVGSDTNASPLLTKIIQSMDAGITWAEVTSPAPVANGTFFSVSCGSSTCVAVGSISSATGPLMFQTTNLGKTWTVSNLTLATSVQLTTVSCDQNNYCFIAGTDTNTGAGIFYNTLDEGRTWKAISVAPSLPNNSFFAGSYAH